MSRPRNTERRNEVDNVTTSAQAQVIPLHGPGREKPAPTPEAGTGQAGDGDAERRVEAPVVNFPRPASVELPAPPADTTLSSGLTHALSFLRNRLTGDYTVDEFGFDAELTDNLVLPPLRALYEKWFRVTTHGVHNLPSEGGALLVCNHSGTLPLDALMTSVAVHDETPTHRHLRGLGADLVFKAPLVGSLARKSGQTLACNPDAERLLRKGELVGVWPEGFKGIGKPFASRYKLQRFGRGGFVSAALRTGVPIIPVSIVGAEEIYPKIGDIKLLARMLGLPYFPVTPFFPLLGPLGAIPLPTKWSIEFGEPISTEGFDPEAEEDPMLVFNLTDQVRESIQQTLYKRLSQREGVFRG
ncbi:lysophospholipid acyltransferase family protein [Amycolatopsis sp.]|jgi:1-acyl-sn-glycerol-3-phosphate acyltransferase|uniref:lysophospholipid acyltransferase family protein n=1 Tax=Amycolatopsis sp. TaxID=37632 RepID=UPI002614DE36|nr:lysophospholipid acyltransferase family protein [Amycolatopsis sp.]